MAGELKQASTSRRGACSDGNTVEAISHGECPRNIRWTWPNCNNVAVGQICEGDGECGTSNILNNCNIWDMYIKKGAGPANWCEGSQAGSSLAQLSAPAVHNKLDASENASQDPSEVVAEEIRASIAGNLSDEEVNIVADSIMHEDVDVSAETTGLLEFGETKANSLAKGDGDIIINMAPKQSLASALRGDIRSAAAQAVFTGVLGKTGDIMNAMGIPGGDQVTSFLAGIGIGSADKTNGQVVEEITSALTGVETRLRQDIISLGNQVCGHIDDMKEEIKRDIQDMKVEITGAIESAARGINANIADLDDDLQLVADDVGTVIDSTTDIHNVMCQMVAARIDSHFNHIQEFNTVFISKMSTARDIPCTGGSTPESFLSLMNDIKASYDEYFGQDSAPAASTVKGDLREMTQCIVNSAGGFADVFARYADAVGRKPWTAVQKLQKMELIYTWYLDKFDKGDGVLLAKWLHRWGETLDGVKTAFSLYVNAEFKNRKTEVYSKFWDAMKNVLFADSPGTRSCPARPTFSTKFTTFSGSGDGYGKCYHHSGDMTALHNLGQEYTAMINRIENRFGRAATEGALSGGYSWTSRFCGLAKAYVCSGGSENSYGCQTGATCSNKWIAYSGSSNPCVFREGYHKSCSYSYGGYGGGGCR